MDDDSVVGPDRVRLQPQLVADPGGQGESPGGVDAAAVGRQDAQPPVADLVAEALDDDGAVGGQHARGGLLLAQELDEVTGGAPVEIVLALQHLGALVNRPAGELADRLPQLAGAAHPIPAPERDRSGRAGRRRHHHPVAADLLDSPRRRAEQERLPRPSLVNHLLVELADAAAVREGHREQAAIGNGARVGHGQLAGAAPGPNRPGDAVPHDPRAQLAELGRRVAAVEHVEHVVELGARQLGIRIRAGDQRVEVVHRQGLLGRRGDGDHLLSQDVEGATGHHRRLDLAAAHAAHHDSRLQQVGAELGEDHPARDVVDAMARAPDALDPARHRLRGLHLDHQVDRAHVDTQLQARGGDQARQASGLEQLLDDQPLLASQRAVVGTRDLLTGQLVEAQRQPLGAPAVVDEDDRGPVLADRLEDLWIDGGPDGAAGGVAAHLLELRALVGLNHRLHRDLNAHVERLGDPRIDDGALPLGTDQEARHLLEGALGGAEPDALQGPAGQRLQALEGERQVRAPLGRGHGVDLVDDHRLGAGQELASLRGQHQVQRLGRGDEDVGRMASHRSAFALRGVAGADRHRDIPPDPPQRCAQVALDVVGERLQRRDVDQPGRSPGVLGEGVGREAIEAPEEGGQRLPRAGGGRDQDVVGGGDGRPRLALSGRRLGEGGLEPRPDAGGERRQRHGSRIRAARRAARRAAEPGETQRRPSAA